MPCLVVNKYFANHLDGSTCFLTKEITIKKILAGKSAEKENERSALLREIIFVPQRNSPVATYKR